MIDELNREALVAENCQLNYAAVFSNRQAHEAAKELFTFAQTRETDFSIKTYFIRPSA